MSIDFNMAGLVCISGSGERGRWNCFSLHFIILKPRDWVWGVHRDWYDGPLTTFGLGPFAMICFA